MKTDAIFSECRKYRYALTRIWDETKPYAMFIGLTPSTADEIQDDPTVRRCITFAKSWGFGGVCMTNIFAYRATQPADMMAAADPVGPDNDMWLKKLADNAAVIVAAWGNDGSFNNRSTEVISLFQDLKCLKLNKSGEPAHPLYQPKTAVPIKMDI